MQVLASWAAMSRMELARMPFILDETATALASGDELAHPASTGGVGLGLVSREKEWAEWPVELRTSQSLDGGLAGKGTLRVGAHQRKSI